MERVDRAETLGPGPGVKQIDGVVNAKHGNIGKADQVT